MATVSASTAWRYRISGRRVMGQEIVVDRLGLLADRRVEVVTLALEGGGAFVGGQDLGPLGVGRHEDGGDRDDRGDGDAAEQYEDANAERGHESRDKGCLPQKRNRGWCAATHTQWSGLRSRARRRGHAPPGRAGGSRGMAAAGGSRPCTEDSGHGDERDLAPPP